MSDFLLLNEKRSINRSSIPGKLLLAPLLHLGSPFGFLLYFNYCF